MLDRNVEFIDVLEVHDMFALRLATSTLDDAGISYQIGGEQPRYRIGPTGDAELDDMPLCKFDSVIQVAREDEKEARELLAIIENPEPVPPDE
jgi:hypothetical protein